MVALFRMPFMKFKFKKRDKRDIDNVLNMVKVSYMTTPIKAHKIHHLIRVDKSRNTPYNSLSFQFSSC